jgi:SAM-dependent methyltransferase
MTSPDWSRTSADYARHRQGFPPGLYDLLVHHDLLRPGIEALDLGTGTGTLARGLAARGATVLGLDPAPGQVAAATRLAAEEGLADARFARASPNAPSSPPTPSTSSWRGRPGTGSTVAWRAPRRCACCAPVVRW